MALINCPDCKKVISDDLPACPHCGRPSPGIPGTATYPVPPGAPAPVANAILSPKRGLYVLPKRKVIFFSVLGVSAIMALFFFARGGAPGSHGKYTFTTDTVSDAKAKLMWQRVVSTNSYNWRDAREYCATLRLGAALSDWRLPTKDEIETLQDKSAGIPNIDHQAFPNTSVESSFWTSSFYSEGKWKSPPHDKEIAWVVFFKHAGIGSASVADTRPLVRCVRSLNSIDVDLDETDKKAATDAVQGAPPVVTQGSAGNRLRGIPDDVLASIAGLKLGREEPIDPKESLAEFLPGFQDRSWEGSWFIYGTQTFKANSPSSAAHPLGYGLGASLIDAPLDDGTIVMRLVNRASANHNWKVFVTGTEHYRQTSSSYSRTASPTFDPLEVEQTNPADILMSVTQQVYTKNDPTSRFGTSTWQVAPVGIASLTVAGQKHFRALHVISVRTWTGKNGTPPGEYIDHSWWVQSGGRVADVSGGCDAGEGCIYMAITMLSAGHVRGVQGQPLEEIGAFLPKNWTDQDVVRQRLREMSYAGDGAGSAGSHGKYTFSADTVYDQRTRLTWQRIVPWEPGNPSTYDWNEASVHCEGLKLGGFSSGWRLPTRKELLKIVDKSVGSPSIDSVAFPNPVPYYQWTSSRDGLKGVSGFSTISFVGGDEGFAHASDRNAARCVHDGVGSAPAPIPAPPDVAAPPKDAKKTATGLAYKMITKGTGTVHPGPTSTVQVDYTGWQTTGKMFDSSITRGEPATFPLNRVIPGWTEGVQLMTEGETMRIWIPQDLAYKGRPPEGMLVFDVTLLKIVSQ